MRERPGLGLDGQDQCTAKQQDVNGQTVSFDLLTRVVNFQLFFYVARRAHEGFCESHLLCLLTGLNSHDHEVTIITLKCVSLSLSGGFNSTRSSF